MTNEVNSATLQAWWEQVSFEGKELYSLQENGELVLHAIAGAKERTVAAFTDNNADALLTALTAKFPEVKEKVKELETEWVAAEDKLKLSGKVERLKDYLQHTNAAGDFRPLFELVKEWEATLNELAEENYQQKLKLAEQAEALITSDHWKETTQAFHDLGDAWKNIGYVDRERNDALWQRMQEARNKFFERKRHNHEEYEKEMLRNLDLKMEVVEKAEELAKSEDWKATSEAFRQLMEQWKSLGRTMPDKNEELWNRFIMAKNVFYDRKKAHYESIQNEQEANYEIKLGLVEKAEEIKGSTDWNATSQIYADILEEWKNVGRVPIEKADELWSRLSVAKDHFFNAKRHHFETIKVALDDNYAQKMALLTRAETIKDSTHWHEVTDELNELMNQWKSIGPVPREHSDTIWGQFLDARKHFFRRKDAHRENRKKQIEKNNHQRLHKTKEFLKRLHGELAEEEDRIADFKHGLTDITPGPKADELKEHLEKLIKQGEERIERRHEKIAEVKQQLKELEEKENAKKDTSNEHNKDAH